MADNGESGMNYDNIFIRMLSRVGDAMLLSILFVLSCVPIITIGTAFTSLYYTAMKGISGDDGYIWKFYTRSFKQNFKQATGMWMLFLVAFFILSVDIWFWMTQWKATGNATREAVFVRECRASYPGSYDVYLYIRPAGEVR